MHRLKAADTAILVSLDFGENAYLDSLQELQQLALSDKLQVVAVVEGKRSRPDPTTYVGSGKVNEIAQLIAKTQASLIIFNHDLPESNWYDQ